jgi:hypothetical protein
MSLTLLIKNDKELRNKINAAFSRPKLEKNKPLLIEPLTNHYGLVGTAFDYLLRFYLERINNNLNVQSQIWVAEQAISCIRDDFSKIDLAFEIVENVKSLKKEFINTGNLSRSLIEETLRMSYLDPILRAGMGQEYIGVNIDNNDIEDIEKQFFLLNQNLFMANDLCILNPTFGEASKLVGGADADIIIDNKLIDIKTTKKLEFTLEQFCQLIGYFMLHRIGGINGDKGLNIKQLGIYYSRYGYLFLFNIDDLIDNKSLKELVMGQICKSG